MKKNFEETKALLEAKEKAFYASFKTSLGKEIDESFELPSDEPLTDDEIRQIDEYWGKYSFAYPEIDYKSFQTFKNRYGSFDVRHCPGNVRTQLFSKRFRNDKYFHSMDNKSIITYIYPNIKHPDVVIRQMNYLMLDADFKPVKRSEVVDRLLDYIENVNPEGIVIKLNRSSGGKGVTVVKGEDATRERLTAELKKVGVNALVIQGFLRQSDFMAKFHNSSVNTIRITTLLQNGSSRVLAALVRAGSGEALVDNWCSGGTIIGIDKETGRLNDWAITNEKKRITTLENGLDLKNEELYIPNFDKIKDIVVACHYRNPYIKMISWDIALDENNEPVLIECNFSGMIQIHEAVTGPVFGEYLDDLLDEFLIDRFAVAFAEQDFIAKEFNDHIVINEYIGDSTDVTIPETLRSKPVTLIGKNTFKGMNISSVTVDEKVAKASTLALSTIKNIIIKNK